jgi:hypothetical protein
MNQIRVKNEIFSYFIRYSTNFCNKGWQPTFVPTLSEVFDTGICRFQIFMEALTLFLMTFFSLRSTIENLVKN